MLADVDPLFFALLAAFLFALGPQFQNLGLPHLDGRTGTAISIASSCLYLWLMAPFLMDWGHWLEPAVLIFAVTGLIRPALSANLAVAGMRHLGPTLTSTLSSTSPLFGTAMGVLWLGEVLTLETALGTAGVVAAIVMLARRRKGVPATWPIWALALPIGAAAIRSLGHVLSKVGMEWIPDPYFAALVGFTVSTMVTGGLRVAQRGAEPIGWRSRGPAMFALAGLCFGSAILALNTALLNGTVVAVVPIVAASPVFTMLLTVLLFRRERLTPRIAAAVFLVVGSVIVIALGR